MDHRRPRNPPIRPLVLIVGAHEDTRAVDVALSAEGFDVITVQDSGDAFHQAWAIHPDIIVADLPMPAQEGWRFVEDLRQSPRTQHIPIVVMSAYVQPLAATLRRVLDGDAHAPVWR